MKDEERATLMLHIKTLMNICVSKEERYRSADGRAERWRQRYMAMREESSQWQRRYYDLFDAKEENDEA